MTTSAGERAYGEIRRSLLAGELVPGSMVSESELASSLSMSRTPVRAALVRLQDEGWVSIYPKRGALVRELTAVEVRESAQVRHALECAGVQLVSRSDRRLLVDRLTAAVDQQQAALEAGDFPGFVALAAGFHRSFVAAAGNALMLQLYDRLHDRQVLSIVRSAARIEREPDVVVAEHRGLVQDTRDADWSSFSARLDAHQHHFHDEQASRTTAGVS